MLLAIDTSSFVLSCALAEKDKLVAEWTVQKRLTHSEQLIPHMDEILKDAGVDQKEITAIAAAKGPGSFTGLRIGLATAKTAAYIWKVPLIGVDTLEALVWNLVGARAFILPRWMPSVETFMRRCMALLMRYGRKHPQKQPLLMKWLKQQPAMANRFLL